MGRGRWRCWLNLGFTDLSWLVLWIWNKDHPSHHQHVGNSGSQEFRRSHPGRIYRMPSIGTLGWNPVQYYNYRGPKREWSEKKEENQLRGYQNSSFWFSTIAHTEEGGLSTGYMNLILSLISLKLLSQTFLYLLQYLWSQILWDSSQVRLWIHGKVKLGIPRREHISLE